MSGDDSEFVPEPDAPVSADERKQAEELRPLIDALVAGQTLPPAMTPDQRALTDTAAIIATGVNPVPLAADKRDSIVTEALRRASLSARPASISSLDEIPVLNPANTDSSQADSEKPEKGEEHRTHSAQILPWALTAVAAAAAVFFYLARPAMTSEVATGGEPSKSSVQEGESLATIHRSRPSDAEIGVIAGNQSGNASDRMDTIYASRLDGYRDLTLRPRLARRTRP